MAQATDLPTTSRFHNLSNAALADALGHADASAKGAEAECKALKDEIKRRGLLEAAGDRLRHQGRGADFRPARCCGRQAAPRRFLAALRGRHGLDRRPHQGREATRCGGLSPPDWLPRLAALREPSPSPAFKESRYE